MNAKKVLLVVASLALTALLAVVALRHTVIAVRTRGEVPVSLVTPVSVTASVRDAVDVKLDGEVAASATLEPFAVAVDQRVDVPIRAVIDVPLDAKIMVDDVINVRSKVPVDLMLTEKELDLSRLEVPIDDDIFIDDIIDVETVVPIDSTATTLLGMKVPVKMNVPVKLRVPVRQKIHVRDHVVIGLTRFRLPLHLNVPIVADVPVKQEVHVYGRVQVPVDQTISVPLKQRLEVAVPGEVPVKVKVGGAIPARLASALSIDANLGEGVKARVGEVRIDGSSISLQARDADK
jgi:hypothetical protein